MGQEAPAEALLGRRLARAREHWPLLGEGGYRPLLGGTVRGQPLFKLGIKTGKFVTN